MESPPMSPQEMSSAQESTDSLVPSEITLVGSTTESEGPRFNIIKELVETERKYVQDLEVMQVRHLVAAIVLQLSRRLPSVTLPQRPRRI